MLAKLATTRSLSKVFMWAAILFVGILLGLWLQHAWTHFQNSLVPGFPVGKWTVTGITKDGVSLTDGDLDLYVKRTRVTPWGVIQ